MSFINKAIRKHLSKPRRRRPNEPLDSFTIRLNEGGSIVGGLTVDDATGGPRDLTVLPKEHRMGAHGNLIQSGGVNFTTPAGKRWFIKFTEFAFVFNGRELPQPKFTKPGKPKAIKQEAAVVETQAAA